MLFLTWHGSSVRRSSHSSKCEDTLQNVRTRVFLDGNVNEICRRHYAFIERSLGPDGSNLTRADMRDVVWMAPCLLCISQDIMHDMAALATPRTTFIEIRRCGSHGHGHYLCQDGSTQAYLLLLSIQVQECFLVGIEQAGRTPQAAMPDAHPDRA